MGMGFIDVEQYGSLPADFFKERLKLCNECLPFLRIGLAQHLSALFPTQSMPFEQIAQIGARGTMAQESLYVGYDLGHRPAMTWQVVVDRFRRTHRFGYLFTDF